jgi:NuA3 HAT complex component NTO1
MFSTNASENLTLGEIAGPSGLSAEEKAVLDVGLEITSRTSAVPTEMHAQAEAGLAANEEMVAPMVLVAPENQEEDMERQPQPQLAPGLQVQPHEPRPETTEVDEEREETRSELEARIAKIPIRPNVTINLEGGRIIVEELDTPKIRREKARRRKAERAAAAAAAAQGAPKAEVQTIRDDASDLSSLSDLESERGDDDGDDKPVMQGEETISKAAQVTGVPRVPHGPAALITTGSALVVLEPEKRLEGGTLGTSAWSLRIFFLTNVPCQFGLKQVSLEEPSLTNPY